MKVLPSDPTRILRASWAAIGVAGAACFALLLAGVPGPAVSMPSLPPVGEVDPLPQSTKILDANGKLIAALHGEENRFVVPLEEIPKHMRLAVLAIEDHRFYDHDGLNFEAIGRALIANLASGQVRQGGSTITQQYVRNAFREEIGRGRTIERKVREAIMALRVERSYEKNQILESYLNTVYFGRGAYGVQAAAQEFFGKPARALTLAESAYLAGVIQAPGYYAGDRKRARARRNQVLARMGELGYVSAAKAARAAKAPLRFSDGGARVRAAYFVEFVRRQLRAPESKGGFGLSDEQILTGGLTVETTLDLRMQRAAERAVRTILPRKDDPEAALVAMTTDGRIRAMVGGRDFTSVERARGFNFATQIVRGGGRQPGSAFKPFTLAAWLDDDRSARTYFSAPSRVTINDDQCESASGRPWRPANYGNQGFGSMSVVEATEKSVNTVYAQMVARVGPRHATRMAHAAGITSRLDPVCSIALGTSGVTPYEVARAYATFAARGVRPDPIAVTEIRGADGEVIATREPASERTIERKVADRINAVLERVVRYGTGTPAQIGRPAAGKTGTTEERRDVWFAGYTPHPGLVAAAWVGHPPDRKGRIKPMRTIHGIPATGGMFPGRIWREFMLRATKGMPERDFPNVSLGETTSTSSPSRYSWSSSYRSDSSRRDDDDDDGKDRGSRGKGRDGDGDESSPGPEPEPTGDAEPEPPPEPEPTEEPAPEPTQEAEGPG